MAVDAIWEYVAGPRRWAELVRAWQSAAALRTHLDRYRVDAVLLNSRLWQLIQSLEAHSWSIVHLEDRYALLVRQHAAPHLSTYRYINPWEAAPVTPDNAHAVLDKTRRVLAQRPQQAHFAWAHQAEAFHILGRYEEAREAARRIPASCNLLN